MKTLRLLSLVVAMTAMASISHAGELHLPGRPVQRAGNLVRVVVKPVRTVVVGVAKVKPVRSVLKVLFF